MVGKFLTAEPPGKFGPNAIQRVEGTPCNLMSKVPRNKRLVKSIEKWDFPGATVVKNLPSTAVDTGSVPGLEPKIPHAQGISACTR